MAQFDTKVLANVGFDKSGSGPSLAGGNQGYSGKYYTFDYWVTGTSAAVTAVPIGVAPCPCTYVGCSFVMAAGTAGTLSVTASPKILPYDTGTAASLNTTDPAFGTTVVAFPAFTSTNNFDGSGAKTQHGSNSTTTATGITDAVLKTGSAVAFRQGDAVAITTSGTFTGSGGLLIQVVLKEQNGAF